MFPWASTTLREEPGERSGEAASFWSQSKLMPMLMAPVRRPAESSTGQPCTMTGSPEARLTTNSP